MKRFLLAVIVALVLVVGSAAALVARVQPTQVPLAGGQVPAQLLRCYPIIEDLELHIGVTLCLWILPPPSAPKVPEKEAGIPELTF